MPQEIIQDIKQRMQGGLNALSHNLNGLRTGRASVALLEPIQVEVYGSRMQISQLGTVNAPEPNMLTIQIWDVSAVSAVEKAIQTSALGLNPITEGASIRVPIPPLSEERRKELAKKAHEYAEQSKIAIRNIRRDAIDKLKKLQKDKAISEDELHSRSDEVQKITDDFIKKIDDNSRDKEKEIMSF